jgi:hypothetical protein
MSDIFREVDEDLRRDQFDKLWKKYGPWLLTVAVLIVAATAAWVGWQRYQEQRETSRTATFAAALAQLADARTGKGDLDAALGNLSATAGQLGGATGTLARFYEAGLMLERGKRDEAIAVYDQIAGSGGVDQTFRDLALLLSCQQQLDTAEPAQLAQRIEPLTKPASPWRHSARELLALLAVRGGDIAKARGLFEELARDPEVPSGLRARATQLAAFYEESK